MPFNTRADFWSLKRDDGANRSHVLPQPGWHLLLRIAQLILAIIVVALVGYADDVFGATPDSFAYTFFVFAWTVLYLGWLLISIFFFTVAYHPVAHIIVETLTVIFWLACWATLAHDASQLGDIPSGYDGYYNGYYYHYSVPGRLKRAINCVKASAAMGALTWVLFVVTLVSFGLSGLRSRRASGPAGAGTEAGTVDAKAGQQPFEMAPVAGGGGQPEAAAHPNGQQGYYQPEQQQQQQQQHYQAQPPYEGQQTQEQHQVYGAAPEYTQTHEQTHEQTYQHHETHGSAPAPYPGT